MTFHEIAFPPPSRSNPRGGPERKTEVVALGSGFEERNAVWANSRPQLQRRLWREVARRPPRRHRLFEARMGRLYGFRFKTRPISNPARRSKASRRSISRSAPATVTPRRSRSPRPTPPARRAGRAPSPSPSPAPCASPSRITRSPPASPSIPRPASSLSQSAPTGALTAGFEFDTPVRFRHRHAVGQPLRFRRRRHPSIPLVEIRV